MNDPEKENPENHPPPLPSIESSFPVFEINYNRKICDILYDKNSNSINQSSNITIGTKYEQNYKIDNIQEKALTTHLNSNNGFSKLIFNGNEILYRNSYTSPNITNGYPFIQGNLNILNENNNMNPSFNQTEYKSTIHYEDQAPPISFSMANDHLYFKDMKYSKTENEPKMVNSVSVFPAENKKNESPSLQCLENKSIETKIDLDSSNNSPANSSIPSNLSDESQSLDSSTDRSSKFSNKNSSTNSKEITIDPNQLGFIPRDYWIRSGIITLDQLKRDFFRARSSKSLRFEFKLWNALAITKRYPSLFTEIGVKWVAHVLIMVHRDIFGKLLNVSRPSAALFSSCGAFMTHGFVELTLREAKQKLYMLSFNGQTLNNKNGISENNSIYQNQSNFNSQMNIYYNRPNIYSNPNGIMIYQNQMPNLNCHQQIHQIPFASNNNAIPNEFIQSYYPFPNQQSGSVIGVNFVDKYQQNSSKLVDPPTDLDFDLPSEIDESIVRLFMHKTVEFTEESHANEITKCKWSNESRSQVKNFKI